MRRTFLIILVFWFCQITKVEAQRSFSLKECISYSATNNGNIKIANYDIEIAQKKVNEQLGTILPQIDLSSSYTDNLSLATSLLPGEIMGKPGTKIPVTMGTKHNAAANLQLTQKVFDPTFMIALKAAKISKKQAEQTFDKTNESTIYNISKTYYQTLVVQKQINVLRSTLRSSETLLASTDLKYKNGMAKKVDVNKIKVSCNNTKTQLDLAELNYKQTLNNLKNYIGMPVDSSVVLSDTTLNFEVMTLNHDAVNVENRLDYQLQKTTLQLYEADKKRNVMTYLPTLSFNAGYSYSAMRQEFNIFDMSQDWYKSSNIGVSLKIPIFDGFQKHARVKQSQLNIDKTRENMKLMEQSIKLDVSNYENQYLNALNGIKNEKDNLDLAQDVYKNTQMQYQEGTGSSLDLVQSESSLRESQNNYFNKLLNLYIARIDLEKAKGTLLNFINNQK